MPVPVKQDAETLAWFGTAYGRRETKDKPALLAADLPESATGEVPSDVDFGEPGGPQDRNKRRYAPFILLFAVLTALMALRLMPLEPPSGSERVRDTKPFEAVPPIEASAKTDPGAFASEPMLGSPMGGGEDIAAQVNTTAQPAQAPVTSSLPMSQEPEQASNKTPELPGETPSPGLEPALSSVLPAELPPVTLLEAAKAPEIEARTAASPAPANVPPPVAVAVLEGRMVAPLPAEVVAPPRGSTSGKSRSNGDIAIGNAHFERGDLQAARAAFAKAFELGLPEAALALGNTFDPVSLAKAGVRVKGDPAVARRWYRRAFELAMTRPGRRKPW